VTVGSATGTGRVGLLTGLLPDDVAVFELFHDPPDVDLFPQEVEAVAGAGAVRRREFATVRYCARAALARVGAAPGPILPRREGPRWAHRAPRWPEGFVGSMTHCDGYRAAAVARCADVASLGIDAEPNITMPAGVLKLTALPEERDSLVRLHAVDPSVAWDRMLFSAKESVYKAWFPLTGRWLDFHECVIVPDPYRGTFVATLRVPGPVVSGVRTDCFHGRWCVLGGGESAPGHVATAVVVGARSA
jgi:4'-phosphopantetheinyl transferase EntD